ncbi:sphingomyelin phosphodiesterase [Vibrio aquimaris]|uniref:Phospholipase C n=1 Tax=Vibrio aquimaris TaxID=2587862 RepID=A0A5P9CKW6_9VIBR|nr:sphingomyelin phosphodiesterase [Vibrio aquimaris]QFT26651.1 Phospholipase C precursor [Vibrio aquimaris]
MKRLSNTIILLLLTFTANADTSIYILNNTESEIDFNVIGLSSLINRKHTEPLQPYKQTYVAELSRYSGVKAGEVYDFYIFLGESHLSLAIKLEGTIWGSNISYTFADPESLELDEYHTDRNIYAKFKGRYQYYLKASYTGGYDEITLVIDEIKPLEAREPKTLNLVTYNVWMLSHVGKYMRERDTLIARSREINTHDVVFTQELFRYENVQNILWTMQQYFPFISNKLDGGGINTYDGGVLTFSKYPIVQQAQHVFQNCKGTDCSADKGILYTKIMKGDSPFHLFNVHLGAWNSQAYRNIRTLQVGEIFAFIDQLDLPNNEPVIIGGDFNIAKHKFPLDFEQMQRVLDLEEPTLEGSLEYSFDPYLNEHLSYSEESDRERLDYILYRNNGSISNSSSQIIVPRNFQEDMWGVWDLSDHFAVSAQFTIAD